MNLLKYFIITSQYIYIAIKIAAVKLFDTRQCSINNIILTISCYYIILLINVLHYRVLTDFKTCITLNILSKVLWASSKSLLNWFCCLLFGGSGKLAYVAYGLSITKQCFFEIDSWHFEKLLVSNSRLYSFLTCVNATIVCVLVYCLCFNSLHSCLVKYRHRHFLVFDCNHSFFLIV